MKCEKYNPVKFANFVAIFFVLRMKNGYIFLDIGINFLCVIQKYTANCFANFTGLYFHDILQHFTTKLCNFTNFRMFFDAVVMNFPILKFFCNFARKFSIMQSVY